MTFLLYVTPLVFCALFGLALAIFIARFRGATGARSLMILVLAAGLWAAGYAFELASPDLESKLFWARLQYFGIVVVPVAWFVFTRRYVQSGGSASRGWVNAALLGVIPLMTLALVWSNDLHHLVWRETDLRGIGSLRILEFQHGPWFWVFWMFTNLLVLSGTIILIRALLSSVRIFSWQIGLALFAGVIPWASNLAYVAGIGPIAHLDWTPFGFVLSGLFLTISLFRYRLVNILPIAHQQIFAGQADRLFVLDSQNRIVDLNPPAKTMYGEPGVHILGKPFAEVCPDLAGYLEQAAPTGERHFEIARGNGPDQQFFDLMISCLRGSGPEPVGRLVSLHEITQLKQQQASLEKAVAERTEELKHRVEQLRFELTQRALAEKRLQEVIESAPDAMLLVDPGGAIREINAQAVCLFGYSRQEILGQSIDQLMPPHRRGRHFGYAGEFFSNPAVRQIGMAASLTARRQNGSLFAAEISLGPLNTADGLWAVCTVRDITARIQAGSARPALAQNDPPGAHLQDRDADQTPD